MKELILYFIFLSAFVYKPHLQKIHFVQDSTTQTKIQDTNTIEGTGN